MSQCLSAKLAEFVFRGLVVAFEFDPGEHFFTESPIRYANDLLTFPRHLGIHSGGMVICDRPVVEVCPVEWARMENRTSWSTARPASRTLTPSTASISSRSAARPGSAAATASRSAITASMS